MFIDKTEHNLVKIGFNAQEEEIFLADMLKISSARSNGVIAQVIKIESLEESENLNIATAKILFTILSSGRLAGWQGNMPGKNFRVNVAKPEEFMAIANLINIESPVLVGKMSGYPDQSVNIDAIHLEKPSLVVGDRDSSKINFLKLLAYQLSDNDSKVVIADNEGDFTDLENALVLKAGKDVKLPLDIRGLESLYARTLTRVSAETRANIENIFSEIEEYLLEEEATHIPFTAFLDAVNAEYENSPTPELSFLSNSLIKLHRKGVFADELKEVNRLFNSFRHNNLIVLDLSEIDEAWREDFVETIVRCNKQVFKRKFFLINSVTGSELAAKIFNQGVKSGISPIFTVRHDAEIITEILPKLENVFAFSAFTESKLSSLDHFLQRLGASETIICGKITNNVPLFLKVPILGEEQQEIIIDQSFAGLAGSEAPVEEYEYLRQIAAQVEKQDEERLEEQTGIEFEDVEEIEESYESEETKDSEETEQIEEEEYEEAGYSSQSRHASFEEQEEDSEEDEEQAEYTEEDEEPEEYYEQEELTAEISAEEDLEEGYESEDAEEEAEEYEVQEEELSEEERNLNLLLDSDEEQDDEEEDSFSPQALHQGYSEEEDGDDDFDYEQNEEFQDESVLDYVGVQPEKQVGNYTETTNEYSGKYSEEAEEDDDFDYSQSGEFQDEGVLDYVGAPSEETTENITEENYEYYQQEQQQETYTQQYSGQDFTEEDLNNFVDLDDEESNEEAVMTETLTEPEEAELEEQEVPKPVKKPRKELSGPPQPDLPVYNVSNDSASTGEDSDIPELKEGDTVKHKKYGIGEVKKVIGYSERRLCSIQFEEVGRRLLDPKLAELELVSKI